VVLVDADAVEAVAFQLHPRVEMLRVGVDRHLRVEVLPAEPRHFAVDAKLVEVLAIRQPIENEYLHVIVSDGSVAVRIRSRLRRAGADGNFLEP